MCCPCTLKELLAKRQNNLQHQQLAPSRFSLLLLLLLLPQTTVQHEAIPQALMRQDILCQAKSGMGKTAVFVISILQNLEPKKGVVQALVLCHTRELAFQVSTHSWFC